MKSNDETAVSSIKDPQNEVKCTPAAPSPLAPIISRCRCVSTSNPLAINGLL
jgi:hypothetical protein